VKRHVIMLSTTVILIVGTFVATLLSDNRPVLGLDLQGGISIVLYPVKGSDLSALNTATSVIRNRVDGLGIAEPDVQRQGDTIVVNLPGVKDRAKAESLVGETAELRFRAVQYQGSNALILPMTQPSSDTTTTGPGGTTDGGGTTTTGATSTTAKSGPGTTVRGATTTAPASVSGTAPTATQDKAAGARERTISTLPIANRPAQQAPSTTSPNLTPTTMQTTTTTAPSQDEQTCEALMKKNPSPLPADQPVVLPDRDGEVCYVLGPAIVTGKSVGSANAQYDTNEGWVATVKFKNNDFVDKIAGPYVEKQVAIELDGVVQSAPTINPGITGRDVQISGDFTQGEAKDLALVLRYGALPVQFDESKQTVESVSPTLGRDQLTAGIVAGLIGLGLVALYMLLYYRVLGLVVVLGLGLTGMLFFTLLSYLSTTQGLTLTLAGVTGIIVSVGVTVDSYVVYFERLKDEVRSGKTVRSSLEPGFHRSFRTIVAADLVSLIGAGVLYVFATSSVKGFAFFLGMSTAIDLVLAYTFMHPLVAIMARNPKLVRLPGVGIASALDVAGATT
jgi:preprotein translocase subunit SecD